LSPELKIKIAPLTILDGQSQKEVALGRNNSGPGLFTAQDGCSYKEWFRKLYLYTANRPTHSTPAIKAVMQQANKTAFGG
jgi:hypothetical protein